MTFSNMKDFSKVGFTWTHVGQIFMLRPLGRMFEVKATLPREKDLRVIVKDYDLIGSDDIIGDVKFCC